MVVKDCNESHHHFMNRLNKLVSQSMAEANLEEHFDVDLGDRIQTDSEDKKAKQTEDGKDKEKSERKREKNRQNLLRRKANKLKKQRRLLRQLNQSDDNPLGDRDWIEFGQVVHCPPNIDQFTKKRKKCK